MRQCILILLICVFCSQSHAQGPVHSFIHISPGDGLASNDVYDIVQDSKGFYWVATDNGLQRYDGKRWIRPVYNSSQSLPVRPVHQVMLLSDTSLMLRMGNLVGIFNTVRFSFTPVLVQSPTSWNNEFKLWKTSRGEVCLIFPDAGLLAYNAKGNLFTHERLPIVLPPHVHPSYIFEDTLKQHYWIAAKAGVYVFDRPNNQLYHQQYNPLSLPFLTSEYRDVNSFYIDKQRNHWIVYGHSRQQYACYNENSRSFIKEAGDLPKFYQGRFSIDEIYQTKEEEVWLFGKSALFNYIPKEKRFYNNKSDAVRNMGAKFSQVRRIMQDREQGIWVATDEGLYQFYTVLPDVRNVVFQTTADDNNITDVVELNNGELWLSSRGKGVIVVDSNNRVLRKKLFRNADTTSFPALKMGNAILRHAPSGYVYVGCDNGYLLRINPADSALQYSRSEKMNGGNITDIAQLSNGKLIIGTSAGKIILYNPARNYFEELYAVRGKVNRLFVDGRQRIWISTTEDGLLAYDAAANKLIDHFQQGAPGSSSLTTNNVRLAVALNDSVMAVASDVLELLNIRTKKSQVITAEQGLLGNTIIGMQKDAQGYLWLATSNGLCRYNHARQKFTVYKEKDGFMKFETVGTSSTALANGKIFFGAGNSFVTFPPHLFNVQEPPPPVLITGVELMNEFIPIEATVQKLNLEDDKNSISFFFSAMTYLHKDKLIYYYRLRGLDENWILADNQHAAIYTVLPPGDFAFEVRCENEDGLSSPPTTFSFHIDPPFWQTWWFVMIVVAAIAAILYLFHRTRMNRLVALAELRNRVARDLHDDVGSTLSTISILSTIAKGKLVDNPLQAEQYITKITDNSQQMMDAMDDIVWSIKPMNDSMQKIVARMREFASGVLEPKNIDVEFIVDERVLNIRLNMESRRDLFLVFKEAINNIAKYSGAQRVVVHVSFIRNRLMLKIKDDGAGFEVDLADSGNGLNNMKKRAAMMQGRIKIASQKDKGTLVLLNIPVNA